MAPARTRQSATRPEASTRRSTTAASLAFLAALSDAGKKTTKPTPAGLSALASQHASDHTRTVGSRDRLYENLRGFSRALPVSGSTRRSRRNSRAPRSSGENSERPLEPAAWSGLRAARPNRPIAHDNVNCSRPTSLSSPPAALNDTSASAEMSDASSSSTPASTDAVDSRERAKREKSCVTPRNALRALGATDLELGCPKKSSENGTRSRAATSRSICCPPRANDGSRGGDGRYRGENRASPVNEALSVRQGMWMSAVGL